MAKLMKSVSVVLAVMLFSAMASAAADKIAIVSIQGAILKTDAAQKSLKSLGANPDFAAMKAEYESLRSDIVSLNKDAETNGLTWSQEQQAKHRKKLEYKAADFKLIEQKLKAEQNSAMQQIMQAHAANAQKALEQLIKDEKVGIVLDRNSVMWADQSYDLTEKLTKKLNKMK